MAQTLWLQKPSYIVVLFKPRLRPNGTNSCHGESKTDLACGAFGADTELLSGEACTPANDFQALNLVAQAPETLR